eukprot:10541249-Karenia_brevis.AAC.1
MLRILGMIPARESEDEQSAKHSTESLSDNDTEDEDSDVEDVFKVQEMESKHFPETYPQIFLRRWQRA